MLMKLILILITRYFSASLTFGKSNLSCDVIVVNGCSHQVILYVNERM